MTAPLQVLHLVQAGPTTGGTVTHVSTLVRAQRRMGVDARVILPVEGVLFDELNTAGVPTILMPSLAIDGPYSPPAEVWGSLIGWKPDLLHAHLPRAGLTAIELANVYGVPMVYTQHMGRYVDCVIHALASSNLNYHVIAVADYARVPLAKMIGKTRVTCVPNGLDAPSPSTLTISRSEGELNVGYVGRLSAEKGPDVALLAFAQLRERFPAAHLHVIGTGPQRHHLEYLAHTLSIARSTSFYGSVAHALGPGLDVDLLLAPSREDAASMIVMEAMASRIPIIATNIGGTAGLLGPDFSRFIAEPEDPSDVAACARRWLALSPAEAQEVLDRSAERVDSLFSTSTMTQDTVAVYHHLLRSTR